MVPREFELLPVSRQQLLLVGVRQDLHLQAVAVVLREPVGQQEARQRLGIGEVAGPVLGFVGYYRAFIREFAELTHEMNSKKKEKERKVKGPWITVKVLT